MTSDIVIKNHLIPHPYLGYQFELGIIKSNLSVEDDKNIHTYCIDFLLLLLQQLQRLPNNISILQTIFSLSIDHCLNPNKRDILSLMKMFFFGDNVLTCIEFQQKKLHTIEEKENSNILDLWLEVSYYLLTTKMVPSPIFFGHEGDQTPSRSKTKSKGG